MTTNASHRHPVKSDQICARSARTRHIAVVIAAALTANVVTQSHALENADVARARASITTLRTISALLSSSSSVRFAQEILRRRLRVVAQSLMERTAQMQAATHSTAHTVEVLSFLLALNFRHALCEALRCAQRIQEAPQT